MVEHEGTGRRVLEFVSIQRKDSGEWAIPGGMVDPGERGEECSPPILISVWFHNFSHNIQRRCLLGAFGFVLALSQLTPILSEQTARNSTAAIPENQCIVND